MENKERCENCTHFSCNARWFCHRLKKTTNPEAPGCKRHAKREER